MPCCPDRPLPAAVAAGLGHLSAAGLTSHIAMLLCDEQGGLLYVSEACCAMLGFGAAELVGKDFKDCVAAGHDEDYCAKIWKALDEGRDWTGELCSRRKDGTEIWLGITLVVTPSGEQGRRCYVGLCTDITERKLAENAHRSFEALLEQALQGNPVPSFVIDAEHVITHWNRALEVITGHSAASMLGTRRAGEPFYQVARPAMADLIVDGRFDGLEEFYHDHYRPSRVVPDAYEAEGFFPHLGDGGRWLSFTAAPLRDARGGVLGAIETLVDITERKRAEEELKRSQSDLELLVERRTEQLALAKAALEEDVVQRQRSEDELRRRNGELTELNARLRETQDQLAQSERLASIGQLAAGVAHEINNPIGYVLSNLGTLEGYLNDLFEVLAAFSAAVAALPAGHPAAQTAQDVCRRKDLAYLKEDVPSLLAESKEGIDRVRKIVADLKDFSRVDTTQEWQFANLHQGLESTLNIVGNEIKYKADVVREYGPLPEVECLPSQLNQVFMNLLVNSAHAIDGPRGRITVRTGADDGDAVWVEFSDTGCGIAEENLGRIFDPFFTTKPVGKGTGLGLSLSYGIVQKHRGSIEVRSRVGVGTTFRVVLPVRQTDKESDS